MDASSGAMRGACFRDVLSVWPSGVAVVTAVGPLGRRHGCTVTSVTGVTLDPPTLLVCLDERSGTLASVRYRGLFAVNLLHAGARRAAEVFASPRLLDRFELVASQPGPRTHQPWLQGDALAVIECEVTACSTVGDHAVVLGTVVHVEQSAGVPLMYGLRRYEAWPAVSDGTADGVPA